MKERTLIKLHNKQHSTFGSSLSFLRWLMLKRNRISRHKLLLFKHFFQWQSEKKNTKSVERLGFFLTDYFIINEINSQWAILKSYFNFIKIYEFSWKSEINYSVNNSSYSLHVAYLKFEYISLRIVAIIIK